MRTRIRSLAAPAACGVGTTPAPRLPDLVQLAPAELSLTTAPDATPPLSKRLARRYVVRALAQRFQRRPTHARLACRQLNAASVRCSARWHTGRYAYRGKVRIFTARRKAGAFERRFDLRITRTDPVCSCSRTIKATNVRFWRGRLHMPS